MRDCHAYFLILFSVCQSGMMILDSIELYIFYTLFLQKGLAISIALNLNVILIYLFFEGLYFTKNFIWKTSILRHFMFAITEMRSNNSLLRLNSRPKFFLVDINNSLKLCALNVYKNIL